MDYFSGFTSRNYAIKAVLGMKLFNGTVIRNEQAIKTTLGTDKGVRAWINENNPFVSIGPILSVPGVRNAICRTDATVVAISPIVGGVAIKGPAARMMGYLRYEVSALGVARIYQDLIDLMIIDEQDRNLKNEIEGLGIKTVVTDTIMSTVQKKINLSNTVLKALE